MSNGALENDITVFFLLWELDKYRLPRDDVFSKIAWQLFIYGVYLRIKGGVPNDHNLDATKQQLNVHSLHSWG